MLAVDDHTPIGPAFGAALGLPEGDAGVSMKDIQAIAAGSLMNASAGIGQQLQKQIGQTGVPVYNVANACATGGSSIAIRIIRSRQIRISAVSSAAAARSAA